MGGLIKTKGTILLAAHFNSEFSTYFQFYRTLQANVNAASNRHYYTLFNPAGWPDGTNVDLLQITNYVTDGANSLHSRHSDGLCLILMPDSQHDPAAHPNLDTRWRWFLNLDNVDAGSPYALSRANHNQIASYIYDALVVDTSYNSISFDVIHHAGAQAVTTSDLNDPVNGAATKVKQILLQVTGPIPQSAAAAGAAGVPPLDGPPY